METSILTAELFFLAIIPVCPSPILLFCDRRWGQINDWTPDLFDIVYLQVQEVCHALRKKLLCGSLNGH
jgi:hypothetical protein